MGQQERSEKQQPQQRKRSDAHIATERSSRVSATASSAGSAKSIHGSHSLIAPPSIIATMAADSASKVNSKANSKVNSKVNSETNSKVNLEMDSNGPSQSASKSSSLAAPKKAKQKPGISDGHNNNHNVDGMMDDPSEQEMANKSTNHEAGNDEVDAKTPEKYRNIVSDSLWKDNMNVNGNPNPYDVVDADLPVPPGPKRHRLDPNKSPGMALDNKDSYCGRLIRYETGGSHPTQVSGTFVPGIRMDGATEGEYPKGMFAQQKRAVKAFVNCFAGYFNTMGGNIPACPGDCPPKGLNLNENSNKANPLKKAPYEYPWSIRAGFLPEEIEAFELIEDGLKRPVQSSDTSVPSTSSHSSSSSPTSKRHIGDAKDGTLGQASSHGASQIQSARNNNNFQKESILGNAGNQVVATASPATEAAAKKRVGNPMKTSVSAASSIAGSDVTLSPKVNGSLWRGLQQQRQIQQLEQQKMQRNTNQNCLEWRRSSSQIGNVGRIPSIHEELRLRKLNRNPKEPVAGPRSDEFSREQMHLRKFASYSSYSSKKAVTEYESDQERLFQFIHQKNADWRPTPASGML